MKLTKKSEVFTEVNTYDIETTTAEQESTVTIRFKNGKFDSATEYFSDISERERWKIRELVAKKIKKIEKRYRIKEVIDKR